MPRIVLILVDVLHLPRVICDHLVGEHHSRGHRLVAGAGVMACGVGVAHCAALVTFPGAGFVLDGLGYAIHGIGLAPYVDTLAAIVKND